MLRTWIVVVACALVGSAGAQTSALTSYDVELIVFRTLSAKATPEDWGMEAGTSAQHLEVAGEDEEGAEIAPIAPARSPPDRSPSAAGAGAQERPSAVSAGARERPPAPTAPTLSFPALATSKFKLAAIADTLRRSRNYQPLAHFGWTQPGFPRGEPRYMSIEGVVPANSGLSGQIALARGRYLHLTLELTYDSPEEGKMVLRQTRRMRSNERHYIDHPKFGVIALITPTAEPDRN